MTSAELRVRCKELLVGADQLARQTQRLVRWRALVISFSAVLTGLLCILLADVVLRREEQGLRLLAFVAMLGLLLGVYWCIIRPAWKIRVSRSQIANWASHSTVDVPPKLAEAMQLAVVIASSDTVPSEDSTVGHRGTPESVGSKGFQRAAMTAWLEENRTPVWDNYVNRSVWWRQLGILGCVCISLLIAFASFPTALSLALGRLANPVGSLPWPLADDLQLANPPAVVALGESVQLEVVDMRPPLPRQVDLLVREAGRQGRANEKRVATTLLDDMAIANLRSLRTAIEVSPVGGEHVAKRWHRIDVVQPPRIGDYRFEIEPPAYSQLPNREISGKRISVLAGSKVVLKGVFETPLSSIAGDFEFESDVIRGDSQPAQSTDWKAAWSAVLAPDTISFTVGDSSGGASQVRSSMRWQLVLKTRGGLSLRLPDVWSVEAKADQPPQVVVEKTRLAAVTAGGKIAVSGSASDDYGLRRIELVVVAGDPSADQPEYRIEIEEVSDDEAQRQLEFRREFEIAKLVGSKAGILGELPSFAVVVEVTDTLGQVTRSSEQPFEVKSPAEIATAMGGEQTLIAQQLSDIVRLQRENQTRSSRALSQLSSGNVLEQTDASGIEGVARTQTEIARQLGDPSVGLGGRISAALDSLQRNGLSSDPLFRQLSQLATEIEGLSMREARDATDFASQAAVAAAKDVAENRAAADMLKQQLSGAVDSGQKLLSRLEGLQDRVAREQSLEQLASDLQGVLQQQKVLQDEAEAVQLQSLDSGDDSYGLRLGQLAGDQALLADQLDSVMQRIANLEEDAIGRDSDALGGEADAVLANLQKAAEAILGDAAGNVMRRASDRLREENFADAANEQTTAVDSLDRALSQAGLTEQGGASELEQMAERTQAQTRLIRELAIAQRALAEDFAKRALEADVTAELAGRQQAVMRRTQTAQGIAEMNGQSLLADQLARVLDFQGAVSVSAESERAAGSTAAKQAADELEWIAQSLDERSEELAGELRKQQAFDLQTRLAELTDRQREIIVEISAAVDGGNSGVAPDDRALAITQSLVSQKLDVETTLREVEKMPTFTWALQRVAGLLELGKAAAERNRLRPDAEDAALQSLQLLEHAFIAIQQPGSDSGDSAGEGELSSDQGAEPEGEMYSMASLRLLRALHADVRQQLRVLRNSADSPRRSRQLEMLASQQESLVELVETMQK